jgi:hypothetical protein
LYQVEGNLEKMLGRHSVALAMLIEYFPFLKYILFLVTIERTKIEHN